ncbi:dihydroneopterin aldolase [Campylobacter geochelonis]|uniref:dihydroneopterin aldolase n=1 Tax=Campylobacter geochelonis TaxID=1780362 RepID=UPI0007706DC4|nr:dihydroneopterin aldolase [Campylobacter geochelonis]CZE50311.1 dihydroneopterin aldolase [Campylobacter geochelonis]
MITVLVEELEFSTIIGLLDFERLTPQKVVISAKFRADEFMDYAKICQILEEDFNENKFLKVEDALEFFEVKFKRQFNSLKYFYMKIIKKEIIKNAKVGAELEKFY